MAKASITLPNGSNVEIEGTIEEVRELLEFYGARAGTGSGAAKKRASTKRTKGAKAPSAKSDGFDITDVVNLIKSCDDAERIETQILDKSSALNRVLLPLYMIHEHLENAHTLSSGDIAAITTQLSVPVTQPNASRALAGNASKYVIGNTSRRSGTAVGYKLNRRGVQHLQSVIAGEASPKQKPASRGSSRKQARKKVSKKAPKKAGSGKKAAKKKSSGSNKGGGVRGRPAAGKMIRDLVADGFFSKPRTIGSIQEHAEHSLAHGYAVNELSTPLRRAVHNKLLARAKNSDGQYEYSES